MQKKLQLELQKRVAPYLPPMPAMANNALPKLTLEDIKNNHNLRHIPDETLMRMFNVDHDSINFRLEGAMDQLEFVMSEMTPEAEMELLHDYPEIAKVLEIMHEYKRSSKTPETVKMLYNLTRYLNLPARTFELETPNELKKALNKEDPNLIPRLTASFSVFSQLNQRMQMKLEEDKRQEEKVFLEKKHQEELAYQEKQEMNKVLQQQEEMQKRQAELDKHKNHPYFINPRPKLTPYNN